MIAGLVVGLLLTFSINLVHDDDVRAICQEHQGVQQVVNTTFSKIKGDVLVVCRDGEIRSIDK